MGHVAQSAGFVGGMRQSSNVGVIQFHESTSSKPMGQYHGAISNSNETTHGVTHCFHHSTNLTVSSFGNGHTVPAI
jgi:hypothetical protein